jgi:hypothetical protein
MSTPGLAACAIVAFGPGAERLAEMGEGQEMTAAGFLEVRVQTRRAGRRNVVIISGVKAPG